MECKYLNKFRLLEFGWTVESCIANDRPYVPSIYEQHNYCKSNKFIKCPLLIEKDYVHKNCDLTFEKFVNA